jgi:hypothetical protein
LTASPETNECPAVGSPQTTSPVLMPVRTPTRTPQRDANSSFSPPSAAPISSAARMARSASSSCSVGTPNTAITASPMNFSTVPPCRSTMRCASAK